MQSIWCLPNGSSTWHQLNGVLYNCRTTGLVVEHILKLYQERRQLPSLLQLQVIQGDGGELSIPKYLTSNSDNCNGSGSISYSSNVFPKKVDMNNSPRLTSVGGYLLHNRPHQYVFQLRMAQRIWLEEAYQLVEVVLRLVHLLCKKRVYYFYHTTPLIVS